MTMDVLQRKEQIEGARRELRDRGLCALSSAPRALLRKLRLDPSPSVGDVVKSWDILKTVKFIEAHVDKSRAVLDIGAYASEILISLHRLGYSNLTGVDLNPALHAMPHSDMIKYEVADFMRTPFADGSFDVITSISVIEHGFQGERLLSEMSRLLRRDGYFIASFDYWPEKIDTTGKTFFGMEWTIFSRQEIQKLIGLAGSFGMIPVGELQYSSNERPIDCAGESYTFGWLVLRKTG